MKVALLLALGVVGCGKVQGTPPVDTAEVEDGPPEDSAPPGPEPVEVAVSGTNSSNHTCARISDGRVFCWGANTIGQVGFPPAPLDTVGPGEVPLAVGA